MEFLGESGVRDDLRARPAQRVDPADVVKVGVGEDEMRDLLVIRESQPSEGRADPADANLPALPWRGQRGQRAQRAWPGAPAR